MHKTTDLPDIGVEFNRLADRFEDYAKRAAKPVHLSVNLRQSQVRAGHLLQVAAEARAFDGDPWWRGGKSPAHPYDDGKGSANRYESDEEFHYLLWSYAVGSWLVMRFPERFRHNAAEWDWSPLAYDSKGRPLGKDGKPLRVKRYKNGKLLRATSSKKKEVSPADRRPPRKLAPGKYSWRLDGKIAREVDFYDEADCMEHLRVRAEVYADACRLLTDLITDSHEVPVLGTGVPVTRSQEMLSDWNALSDRQRNSMRALRELQALDADSRRQTSEIAKKAEGCTANTDGFKPLLSALVRRGLMESRTGSKGGYWLTARGREFLTEVDSYSAIENPSS